MVNSSLILGVTDDPCHVDIVGANLGHQNPSNKQPQERLTFINQDPIHSADDLETVSHVLEHKRI